MQVSNPLQMNDWEIKKAIATVIVIQFALWDILFSDIIAELPDSLEERKAFYISNRATNFDNIDIIII